ncbi:MAG TPA: DivIVA domain-containing protein, partial [Solirubrobacteraceae bacterium]|nr:DivIVA domain-containing protein [Solirubrobacteraceae bacterium]
MALDRESIEKQDFPMSRRGYDPEAVDAHLSAVAAEVEELSRTVRRGGSTLAGAASDQVRAIVEAAEATAAQIR